MPKQGNIKCSFSKIYESTTEVQENQKGNSRETQPKHKKNRIETKKNKEKHREICLTINVAYSVCLKGTLNQNILKWVLYLHLF